MKTVIYYNVTTGESFDQDGSLRTSNNPFSASYGERRTFEWHLMSATNSELPVTQWTPWKEWDIAPQNAVIAADDNYLAAYPGTLKESAAPGTGAVALTLNTTPEMVAPNGKIRLFRQDRSALILSYTAANQTSDGIVLAVELPETEPEFPAGTRADILAEPLAAAELTAETSTPDQGIFSFDLTLCGWRLAEKMEYSDIEQLTAKGLELCISAADETSGKQLVLLCCQVPFIIKNVLTPVV